MKPYDKANHFGHERRIRPERYPQAKRVNEDEQPVGESMDGYNAGVWLSKASGDRDKRLAIAEQIVREVSRNGVRDAEPTETQ